MRRGSSSRTAKVDCLLVLGRKAPALERYAAEELERHLEEQIGVAADVVRAGEVPSKRLAGHTLVFLGTARDNELIADLVEKGAIRPERREQGFAIETMKNPYSSRFETLVVQGADSLGALYAVRDLCHYHLARRGRRWLPKLRLRSAPKILRRGYLTWDYYVSDWRSYIDRLSEWKQNVFMICGHQYMLEQPEMLDYAASRGVEMYLGMGIFSWEFTQIKVHREQAWLPEAPPSWVKRSPDGYVICPSDKRSHKWQVDRILEIVRAMPKIKGFLFQTGILDFPDCTCPECRKLKADDIFLLMGNPVINAVLKERPDLYMVHSIGVGQLRNADFYRGLKNVDGRSVLMIERGTVPTHEDVDLAYAGTLKGGKVISHVKCYGQAGQGYLMPEWRDSRRKAMSYVFDVTERCVKKYGMDACFALVQSRLQGPRDLFSPAFFAETTWHAGVTAKPGFMERVKRIKQVTDLDQRISDPPTTHIREGGALYLNKRLRGTHDDGGWIWGQLRIVTPLVGDTCDLLSEGEEAVYTFPLPRGFRRGLKSAQVVIRGAKNDPNPIQKAQAMEAFGEAPEELAAPQEEAFYFDIGVNGRERKKVKTTWRRGRKRVFAGTFFDTGPKTVSAKIAHRFEGKSNWEIDIPVSWLKPTTRVTVRFRDPDGLVMYDKISLKLNYE